MFFLSECWTLILGVTIPNYPLPNPFVGSLNAHPNGYSRQCASSLKLIRHSLLVFVYFNSLDGPILK
nr:MAG TPA: hypothetical protein [Caudoviricetes sp.]DAN46763.1 MAG TPA: hypothetical protein [Caudoviricetes sp.]